jgi:hypothetical protein
VILALNMQPSVTHAGLPPATIFSRSNAGSAVVLAILRREPARRARQRASDTSHECVGMTKWIYAVEDQITKQVHVVHASRLEFYADSQLHVTEALREYVEYNSKWPPSTICSTIQILIAGTWAGFEQSESTWEPAQSTLLTRWLYCPHG